MIVVVGGRGGVVRPVVVVEGGGDAACVGRVVGVEEEPTPSIDIAGGRKDREGA